MENYLRLHAVARDYYALYEKAESLGIATSVDDPDSPKTVAALRQAVAEKEASS